MRTKWKVRVVTSPSNRAWFDNPFLECLRYAGLVTVHSVSSTEETVFDLHCPSGLVDKTWAEQNAARMRTFGFNAQPTQERYADSLAHPTDDGRWHRANGSHPGDCPGCTSDEARWGQSRQ